MPDEQVTAARASFATGGVALVEFARALIAASNLQELEHAFAPRAGRLMASPMYGFYALDSEGASIEHNVAVNVSDFFVARYVRAMEVDPLLLRSQETQRPVYNLDLMSEAEWEESQVYRDAYSVHHMRHVVEIPIVSDGRIIGALHFAASNADRNFTDADQRIAEAIAGVLAISISGIRQQQDAEQALEVALTALEITGTALVTSSTGMPDVQPNEAARRLLSEIVDEEHLSRLLARRPGETRFSRRTTVALRTGESAILHAHSRVAGTAGSSIVTVLELQREHPGLNDRLLNLLTPRESEVAALIAEGLGDREIGEWLHMSRFTVHQHVKRIYRVLGVDSRVALTRLLLGAPITKRRAGMPPQP
jgi:DNA-binding CsgD family transcriptional regulator/GAF domain-containing protein